MSGQIVELRMPYTQEFVRKRCRNTDSERYWDQGPVVIRAIDPDAAPLAYRMSNAVTMAELRADRASYDVRSFEGSLWWPLVGTQGFVGTADVRLAAEGHEGVLPAIDPSIKMGRPRSFAYDPLAEDDDAALLHVGPQFLHFGEPVTTPENHRCMPNERTER